MSTQVEETGIYDVGDIYDVIYRGRGKDYRSETAAVTRHIREHRPGASSLLDMGCGTGGHLKHFAETFSHVEGIDLSEGMLRVIRRKLPQLSVHQGDMRDFELGDRFDAVVSLFAAVGNLASPQELDAALSCAARHLHPGGVLVVEPWWFPDNFTPNHIGASVTTHDEHTVARVSHTVRDGDHSRMEAHYVVAQPGTGIRHFSDVHVMSLFSRQTYESAFKRAGCSVEYIAGDYEGNGLFIGVKTGGQ
ncbi:class I SAM-dependent methyltransferase [Streptomyces massasporeus]|uniref:Class I SAM-dependent methyltransferase n=1 Tax=Streptomyces massasporeus TaxID=67324 RepID=A0ABW6LQX7_9ACTN